MADEVHLLERLGGREVVEEFVHGWYELMLLDVSLGFVLRHWVAAAPGCAEFQLKRLRDHTVDVLEGAWGRGSRAGPGLFAAHASLHVAPQMLYSYGSEQLMCDDSATSRLPPLDISPKMYERCLLCVDKQVRRMGLIEDLASDVHAAMAAMEREHEETPEAGPGKAIMGFHISAATRAEMGRKALEEGRKRQLRGLEQARAERDEVAAGKEREHAQARRPSVASASPERRPSVAASEGRALSKELLEEMEATMQRMETPVSILEPLIKFKPGKVLRRGVSTVSTACSSSNLGMDWCAKEPMHCTHVPARRRVSLLAGPRVVSL